MPIASNATSITRRLRAACARLALCASCLAVSAQARAQEPAAPALVPLEAPPTAAPAPAAPAVAQAPVSTPLETARAITAELLELERRAQAIELARSRVRITGPHIGKIVSWSASALFLLTAVSSYSRAEAVQDALKKGNDDEVYDVNQDGEVNHDDEQRARRAARALLISSLVPIGLGVFCTLLESSRRKEKRALEYQLEDIASHRRSLITRLSTQLAAAPGHAALQLQLQF